MTRPVNQAGIDLIAQFEGTRLELYNDPAGHCTIGTGHLVHFGNCNGSHPTEAPYLSGITDAQARHLLADDLTHFARCVDSIITVPLNDNQFAALVSFAFNVGCDALNISTLRRRLNAGDYAGVCEELRRWTYADGGQLPGLVRRREAECALFNQPPQPPPQPQEEPAMFAYHVQGQGQTVWITDALTTVRRLTADEATYLPAARKLHALPTGPLPTLSLAEHQALQRQASET